MRLICICSLRYAAIHLLKIRCPVSESGFDDLYSAALSEKHPDCES
jgi:hypothetical protein